MLAANKLIMILDTDQNHRLDSVIKIPCLTPDEAKADHGCIRCCCFSAAACKNKAIYSTYISPASNNRMIANDTVPNMKSKRTKLNNLGEA